MPDTCPNCGQLVPDPRPLRVATPDDHRVGRVVRAVLNELAGSAISPLTCAVATSTIAERLGRLGYHPSVAQWMAERAVAVVLG